MDSLTRCKLSIPISTLPRCGRLTSMISSRMAPMSSPSATIGARPPFLAAPKAQARNPIETDATVNSSRNRDDGR